MLNIPILPRRRNPAFPSFLLCHSRRADQTVRVRFVLSHHQQRGLHSHLYNSCDAPTARHRRLNGLQHHLNLLVVDFHSRTTPLATAVTCGDHEVRTLYIPFLFVFSDSVQYLSTFSFLDCSRIYPMLPTLSFNLHQFPDFCSFVRSHYYTTE